MTKELLKLFILSSGKRVTETSLQILNHDYGESATSCTTVLRWHSQFSTGRESFDYEQRIKALSTKKMDENIARVIAILNKHQRASFEFLKRF